MTTVISRLYASAETARRVSVALAKAGLPKDCIDLILPGDTAQMHAAGLSPDNIAGYGQALSGDKAVVVARVAVVPFGAARYTMELMDSHAPMDLGLADENVYLRQQPALRQSPANTVMQDHPRLLSGDIEKGAASHRLMFGQPGVSARKRRISAMAGGGFVSRLFWPMPLVSKHKESRSVIAGGKHMSRAFWPMPLISSRPA